MVGLNKGKTLKRRAKGDEEGKPKESLLAMSTLAIASKSADSDVDDLPMSAEELGINLDDIKLKVDEQSDEEPSEPDGIVLDEEEEEPSEPEEPMEDLDPDEGTEASGFMREVEEALPRLPFLLTERDGHDIVLFSRSRILPTVRIKLKSEASAIEPQEAQADKTAAPEAVEVPGITGPASIVDFTSDQDLESLMGELGLPKSTLDLGGMSQEEEAPIFGIPPGAIILLEGNEARSLSQVVDRLADAFLAKGKNLTYISTQRDIKDVVESLFESAANASAAMKDLRLLVIPVYPLLRGHPSDRTVLMEKLTGAPQLFDKGVILMNCFTDLLDEKVDDLEALKIWPFLRKLSAGDKVVVLVACSRHRAVGLIRKACSVHLKVAPSGKGEPMVEIAKAPEDKPDRLHLLKLQANAVGSLRILK